MSNETAFPLQWPKGKERTNSYRRIRGPFETARDGAGNSKQKQSITIAGAVDRLMHELRGRVR